MSAIRDLEVPLNDLDDVNSLHSMKSTKQNEKTQKTIVSKDGEKILIGADGLPIHIGSKENPLDPVEHKFEKISEEEEEEDALHTKVPKPVSSITQVFSLLNSLLGAGILSVPNSFTNSGIIPSLFLLILMAALSYLATYMELYLQYKTHSIGLPEMASKTLGKAGSISLSICSLLFLVTAQLAYLILGGNMLESFFALGGIDISSSLMKRAAVVGAYALCLPIALTIPRNRFYLKYCAPITVFSIVFFGVSMIVKAAIMFKKENGISNTVEISVININLFSSLAIYGLAFALPAVCLPVFQQFDKDLKKRSRVSLAAIILCTILVLIPGIFGYLQFGAETKSNIMQNYPDNDILMICVRVSFFFVVSFAYPAVGQSTMSSWSQILFNDCRYDLLIWWKRLIVLLLSNGIPLLIAMFMANAKPALAIGGALGGCIVDFVFPSLMWISISNERWYKTKNLLCIIFILFGVVAAVISTYEAVLDAIQAFS